MALIRGHPTENPALNLTLLSHETKPRGHERGTELLSASVC